MIVFEFFKRLIFQVDEQVNSTLSLGFRSSYKALDLWSVSVSCALGNANVIA